MTSAPDQYDGTPPGQDQSQPGREDEMTPKPAFQRHDRKGSDRLKDRVALISGGDSGIGRAVAVAFAREGADVALLYRDEKEDADARETVEAVGHHGRRAITIRGDVADEAVQQRAVQETLDAFGKLDVLVNNAAEQHAQERFEDITREQLERTFATNVFGMFGLTRAALEHLPDDGAIVNTTSVTAYQGNPTLIDYSSTKGAIVAFTRALSQHLAERGIRVNAVAPGPIWTPLIPATLPPEEVESFGGDVPLGRPGQPEEVAESYVFLASADASYISGQVLHPNGGTVVNG